MTECLITPPLCHPKKTKGEIEPSLLLNMKKIKFWFLCTTEVKDRKLTLFTGRTHIRICLASLYLTDKIRTHTPSSPSPKQHVSLFSFPSSQWKALTVSSKSTSKFVNRFYVLGLLWSCWALLSASVYLALELMSLHWIGFCATFPYSYFLYLKNWAFGPLLK